MRIGVDARCLSVPITGIGQYTLQLLKHMVPKGHDWFLYSHQDFLPDIIDAPNVSKHNLKLKTRFLGTLWSQVILPKWIKEDGIDLFWSPRHHLPLIVGKQLRRVVTIHDMVWKKYPETMRKPNWVLDRVLMPLSVKSATAVICVSQATANDLSCEVEKIRGKISVVYEGACFIEESPPSIQLQSYGIKGAYILFVGTLEPRKNLKSLLKAYATISPDLKQENKLVIVGGKGWGKENVEEIIQQHDLSENVKVLGYVNGDMLSTLYKNAVMLAMPSLYEGFGLPIVEAMSFGTSVMTSNVSSMPEIAGDAAVLVNPSDVESIKNGMESILKSPDLRKTLSEKGRQRVAFFTWEKAAEETLKVFEKAFYEKQSKRKI